MQVLPFFFLIMGLFIAIILIIELIGLILNFLPYLVILNWIILGTSSIMSSYDKFSLFRLIQFAFGVGFLCLAVLNIFVILRRDVEDKALLTEQKTSRKIFEEAKLVRNKVT